jgi:hypothetical protein
VPWCKGLVACINAFVCMHAPCLANAVLCWKLLVGWKHGPPTLPAPVRLCVQANLRLCKSGPDGLCRIQLT